MRGPGERSRNAAGHGAATVTLTSTARRSPSPAGTSIMRAAALAGIQVPKLCATDSLEAFGSCRLCLVEIEGRPGTRPRARRRSPRAWWSTPRRRTLERLRRGVMELYISDHPLDCLTCAANGDCELQDMAGAVGLREVRYGYAGEPTTSTRQGRVQPLLHLRPVQVHRLFALRARLRRGAGHLRPDHRRPRLRIQGRGQQDEPFLTSECVSCGACVQACPTATLTEKR